MLRNQALLSQQGGKINESKLFLAPTKVIFGSNKSYFWGPNWTRLARHCEEELQQRLHFVGEQGEMMWFLATRHHQDQFVHLVRFLLVFEFSTLSFIINELSVNHKGGSFKKIPHRSIIRSIKIPILFKSGINLTFQQ